MIETVNNLKNNRAKGGAAASAVVAEHVTRMRKIVGSLNAHTNRASEPLRVGLHDIRNAEKSGKWWLVGASWRGEEVDQSKSAHSKGSEQLDFGGSDDDYESTNLLQLAKEQRMNTEIRRAIFISIMSATDYKDAHLRLLKLHLRKAQELEVPRILLQCAGAEQNYNPYYTFIAKKLCTDRKLKMAFQFSLWDLFKRMGERSFGEDEEQPDSEDEDEALKTHQLVNFGKMYGVLIAGGALNVGILKVCAPHYRTILYLVNVYQNLNFAFLRPKTRAFLEVLFTTAILETQKRCKQGHDEQALSGIFEAATSTPQVIPGLRLFFQRLGNAAEFAKSGHEKETVQWGFRVSRDALTRIQADAAKSER